MSFFNDDSNDVLCNMNSPDITNVVSCISDKDDKFYNGAIDIRNAIDCLEHVDDLSDMVDIDVVDEDFKYKSFSLKSQVSGFFNKSKTLRHNVKEFIFYIILFVLLISLICICLLYLSGVF